MFPTGVSPAETADDDKSSSVGALGVLRNNSTTQKKIRGNVNTNKQTEIMVPGGVWEKWGKLWGRV